MRQLFGRVLVVVGLLLPAGCGETRPRRYPVGGTVTVNGKPAALVRVQFRHADQTLPGNLKTPMGMTDDTGAFQLSTSGDKDGAVPGDYTVTFEWMSANELSAYDKFGGKLANPAASQFKATVEAKPNQLAPFEIKLPESAIVTRPPRGQ